MRCLVTGGAGFIGSHLANKLTALGHEAVVLDKIPVSERDNCVAIKLVEDVSDYGLLFPRCDWCFHLAALADVVPSIKNPVEYFRNNVDGTVNILNHCVRSGVKKFVYASSTSIYGIPEEYPTTELAPAAPQYPYALTKYLAEQCVMSWGKFYKLPVTSLRMTTVYGPGMKSRGYGSAFKVFMAQKANNAPFTVVGDGRQTRDFIYVDDVVDAFIKAAESDVKDEVFNIGSGEPRLVTDIIKLLGGGEVVQIPKRPGEPEQTWADIVKAYVLLGWEPKVTLEEGMKVMLEHLDDWKEEPVWTPESIENATRDWFRYLSR